jgi:2-polyprenyl-6-methoxyphenol hydroxylase-like FAD-dependent oxidoreductase
MTPASVRDVVVVGAGIAGLACALACARAGAAVQVLASDRTDVSLPQAMHVDVVPSMVRDLESLGVARRCAERGFAYSGIAVVDEQGRPGFVLPVHRLASANLPSALGIELPELLDVLTREAERAGAIVHSGLRADAIDARNGHVRVGGARALRADVVVCATGAASTLASTLFDRPGAVSEPQEWWYAMVPRPTALDRPTLVAGLPGRRLMIVPTGMSRAGVAVFRPQIHDEVGACATSMRALLNWGDLPKRIAESLRPGTPTVWRRTAGLPLSRPWHRGAVLCVGAAAHPVAPVFGQAAAQAVEDAVVLGELMALGLERDDLLNRFTARRAERASRAHALADRAMRWISQPEPTTDLLALAGEFEALVSPPA